jgi:hypothetical protein
MGAAWRAILSALHLLNFFHCCFNEKRRCVQADNLNLFASFYIATNLNLIIGERKKSRRD